MARVETKAVSTRKGAGVEARISAEQQRRMIAEAAYYRAERRGFVGGDPVADWLMAEAEIKQQLAERR